MATLEIRELTNRLNYANKRVKYAWAKYYEEVEERHATDTTQYRRLERAITEEAIPTHIKNELKDMASIIKKKWECPICMSFIEEEVLEITNCGHFYCKECLDRVKKHHKDSGDESWRCAVCRRKHNVRDD